MWIFKVTITKSNDAFCLSLTRDFFSLFCTLLSPIQPSSLPLFDLALFPFLFSSLLFSLTSIQPSSTAVCVLFLFNPRLFQSLLHSSLHGSALLFDPALSLSPFFFAILSCFDPALLCCSFPPLISVVSSHNLLG